jgi:uncharacterized membrane protein
MLKQARGPLLAIIWGGLLYLLDLSYSQTTGGEGFRLDLLDDTLGVALILYALSKLSSLLDDDLYHKSMQFAQGVAVIELVRSLDAHWIYQRSGAISLLITVVATLVPLGLLLFSFAMRRLCEALEELTAISSSWTTTLWLVGLIYVIPTLLFLLNRVFDAFDWPVLQADLTLLGLIVLVLGFLPALHLLLSVWRTQRVLLLLDEVEATQATA